MSDRRTMQGALSGCFPARVRQWPANIQMGRITVNLFGST